MEKNLSDWFDPFKEKEEVKLFREHYFNEGIGTAIISSKNR